jgi:iron complex transport system ATP-binding protein
LKSRARGGAVVISVLHDLTLALAADRLMVLADGEVRADGAPDEAFVRDTMTRVFDNAFSVEPLSSGGLVRWAAVPIL